VTYDGHSAGDSSWRHPAPDARYARGYGWQAGWKDSLERSLLPAAFRSRAYKPARYLNRRKAVIVTYHGFTDTRSHHGIENHERKHVHVDDFRTQVAFLKQHYQVLPLADLVRILATGEPLPERSAVITIDDGYRSTYTLAYPVLREQGVPAVVFFATEYVDAKRYLWTDRVEYAIDRAPAGTYRLHSGGIDLQLPLAPRSLGEGGLNGLESRAAADRLVRSAIKALPQATRDEAVDALERTTGARLGTGDAVPAIYQPVEWTEAVEMARSGVMAIGSHTHTHVILSRCRPEAAADELQRSRQIIENRLSMSCDLFCYPNGRRGDFNETTKQLVQEAGYTCALTTVHGLNAPGADVFTLKRYPMTGRMVQGELEVRLSGVVEWPSTIRDAAGSAFAFGRGSRRHG